MKVALIIEWLDPWRGGAETSTAQFVQHLIRRGVDLTVFTRSRPSPTPHLRVCHVPANVPARSHRTLLFVRRAEAAVTQERFDVIHALSPCRSADVYQPRGGTAAETVLRNLAIRPPGVWREVRRAANRFNLKQRTMLRLERELLAGTRRPIVVAVSDYVARQLREHYAYPAARVRRVFNGVDPDPSDAGTRRRNRAEVRRLYAVEPDDLLVIMVAHNFRLKGLRRWIEAVRLLVARTDVPVRSLIVGKDRSPLWERLVAREGLSDRVRFTGPTRRVEAFFHAADVLVHPTYYDPCSRVVLEAMVAGLPVITTRYDGASEVIEHGTSGLVVDEANCIRALADGVVRLTDHRVRARIGKQARKAAEGVSMKRHADGVVEIYRELMH